MKAVICLLAGGAGSRMGGGKPLRLLGGRPLIAYAHDVARQSGLPIWLSLRDQADAAGLNAALDSNLPTIVDLPGVPGPLGAIIAALRAAQAAQCDAIVTLPCDAPFLPREIVARLVTALASADAAVARTGADWHPVCAAWRATSLPTIERQASAGRLSLRSAAEAVAAVGVDWPDAAAFININTADQLARAQALLD